MRFVGNALLSKNTYDISCIRPQKVQMMVKLPVGVERQRKRLNCWRQMVASRLSQVVDCTTTCPGYITAAGRNEDGRYDCEDGRNDKRREKQRWVVSALGFLVYIN
ncbi:hypothetical protein P8452_76603 [Trifolium repens]|nr:hypothetical protein P8452_76603 [Trifolium repens]